MEHPANGKMHAYSQLQGGNTGSVYVVLDGSGGGSSYYNYKMLWEPWAGEATIVTIDYLGYGMSESTNAERTVDNVVSEIDTALSQTGIEGPYIFVSHSLGGFYTTGYSIKYPQKVAALILLDNAIPDDVLSGGDAEMAGYKQARPLYMLLKYTGILRFMTDNSSTWLNEEEQKASTYFEIKMLLNRTIMNEIGNTANNALYLDDQEVPPINTRADLGLQI